MSRLRPCKLMQRNKRLAFKTQEEVESIPRARAQPPLEVESLQPVFPWP